MFTNVRNLIFRLAAGVRRDGPLFMLDLAKRRFVDRASRWADLHFDWFHGTETAGIIETPDLAVASVHKDHGIRYQPTRARPFRRLMRVLQIPPGEVFVDIGSGKGRVLIMASAFGPKKIIGVDYAPELCDIARRNLVSRGRRDSTIATIIHCCDAAEYGFEEGETVIYMFNPFDTVVLDKMLQRLAASLRRAPRKAWLIYHFPRWNTMIESQGMFQRLGYYVFEGCEFMVYTHNPD